MITCLRNNPPTTEIFETFWKYASERQAIFFRRLHRSPMPWTDDATLMRHKFTNCFRASDRVSQYLIQNVLYKGAQNPREVFFRTLVFKLFNKIETWEFLQANVGAIETSSFSVNRYSAVLDRALSDGRKIYSAAYIMPAYSKVSGRKHRGHLSLLKIMLDAEVPERLSDCRGMRDAFALLRTFPLMGSFLAFQYVVDLNYSDQWNFSEAEFVVAGPGARSGIEKCFRTTEWSKEDLIRWVFDHQEACFSRFELQFRTLWGRRLQLIDCQNLFCEVDKYSRAVHPGCEIGSGRTKIKQLFRPSSTPLIQWYPPKWGINDAIRADLGDPNGSYKVSA